MKKQNMSELKKIHFWAGWRRTFDNYFLFWEFFSAIFTTTKQSDADSFQSSFSIPSLYDLIVFTAFPTLVQSDSGVPAIVADKNLDFSIICDLVNSTEKIENMIIITDSKETLKGDFSTKKSADCLYNGTVTASEIHFDVVFFHWREPEQYLKWNPMFKLGNVVFVRVCMRCEHLIDWTCTLCATLITVTWGVCFQMFLFLTKPALRSNVWLWIPRAVIVQWKESSTAT